MSRRGRWARVAVLPIVLASFLVQAEPAHAARCQRVGATPFEPPRLSRNGSVVYATSAPLVRQDTNRTLDVYAQDLKTKRIELISAGTDGRAGEARSGWPSITADGRYVAFESDARSLAAGDDPFGRTDVFVRDRLRRTTRLVSAAARGRSGAGASGRPDISPDGRLVAFQSLAPDLVRGDTNELTDVFVRDLAKRSTTWVSALPGGRKADQLGSTTPTISVDGKVAFDSTEAFAEPGSDLRTQLTSQIAYFHNIVLRDLKRRTTQVISIPNGGGTQDGLSYRPELSDDGRFLAFESSSTNLVEGDGNNSLVGLRGLFETDVFVRDVVRGTNKRASVSSDGSEATGSGSSGPAISAHGERVAFESGATNLAPNDRNGNIDVFVHTPGSGRTVRGSTDARGGDPGSAGSLSFGSVSSALSGDGRYVAFVSSAPDHVGRRGGLVFGVFVRRISGGRLLGPFGIGCVTGAAPRSSTVAGASFAVFGRPLVVLCAISLLLSLIRARRRGWKAVVALAVALVAVTPSAAAHHYSPIQPGGPILTEDDPNGGVGSVDFVFRDRRTKDLFIGTAGHVVRAYPNSGLAGIGSRVPMEGVGTAGRLVYYREGSNSFSRQDFGLVKIDRDKRKLVDPAVRTWGGPSAIADPDDLLPGEPTFQYGQGAYFRHSQATRVKPGSLQRIIDDAWGWKGWYLHSTWIFGGDSGSPVLVGPEGEALGVTSSVATVFGEPGLDMGPTAYLILQELRLNGFPDLELVTAPFHGVAGDVQGTAEHCAAQPIEEDALNEGCVRPQNGP